MAMHASWKGHLRISLVSIPMQAFTVNAGNESSEVSFRQLHDKCKSRIQYKKFCPIHGEVSNDEIVSGYEVAKDQYVVMAPKEIEAMRSAQDQTITIEGFIRPDEIDSRYLNGQCYFLIPDGAAGEKAFDLIRLGLEGEKLQGIGRGVISRRQRLVRLRAAENLLLIDVLHYSSEIKPGEDFERPVAEKSVPASELRLTKSLLHELILKRFELADFKDDFSERVMEEVRSRAKGVKHHAAHEKDQGPRVINLMDALEQSLKTVKTPKKRITAAARVTKPKKKKPTSRSRRAS